MAARNQEATVYVGNLDPLATDALVWELFLQAGPIVNVHLPKDRVSMSHQSFGFVEYQTEEDAEYACRILNQIKLFGKPIRVNKASADRRQIDVGANLFIGNLDPAISEDQLYETFSTFGTLVAAPSIQRDPQTGASKGFGFLAYDAFEASDAALEQMNGQFLGGRAISVDYAFKKDNRSERHGTEAERILAAQAKRNMTTPFGGGAAATTAPPAAAANAPLRPPTATTTAPPGYPVYS